MVERSHTAGWWPSVYEPLRRAGHRVAEWFAPKSDAVASATSYHVGLELPGVQVEDIDIAVQGDTLVVRGEKRFAREEQGESYFFSEREYGSFQRSFRLPPDADMNAIAADFKDGALTTTIPKPTVSAEAARRVPIRST